MKIYYKAKSLKTEVVDGAFLLVNKGSAKNGDKYRICVVTTKNHTPYSACCSPVTRDVATGESVKLSLKSRHSTGIMAGSCIPSKDDILVVKYVRGKPCKNLVPGVIVMRPDSGIPFVVTSANHKSFYVRCLLTGARSKFSKTVNMSSVKSKVMS